MPAPARDAGHATRSNTHNRPRHARAVVVFVVFGDAVVVASRGRSGAADVVTAG
jgi:hypothetical protein